MTTARLVLLVTATFVFQGGHGLDHGLVTLVTEAFVRQCANCLTLVTDGPVPVVELSPIPHVVMGLQHHLANRDVTQRCSNFLILSSTGDVQEILNFFSMNSEFLSLSKSHFVIMSERALSRQDLETLFSSLVARNLVVVQQISNARVMIAERKSLCGALSERIMTPEDDLFETTEDFSCLNVTAISFDYAPSVTISSGPQGQQTYTGIEVHLFNLICESLGFASTEIKGTKDGEKWGRRLANGAWTGLIGDLVNQRSDVVFGHLYFDPELAGDVDFTEAYDNDELCFMIRKPEPKPVWMTVFLAFDSLTWVAVTVALLASTLFLYIYVKVSAHAEISFDAMAELVLAGALLVSRPRKSKLRNMSIQIFFGFFFVSFFVVAIDYKGSFISNLSIPQQDRPIDALKELVAAPIPVKSLSNFTDMFIKSNDPELRALLQNSYQLHDSYEEAFANVSGGQIAMVESHNFLDYNIRKHFTNQYGETEMHVLRECVLSFRISFGLQKDSVLTNSFSRVMKRAREAGFIDKWTSDEMDKTARMVSARLGSNNNYFKLAGTEVRAWSIRDLQIVFILFTAFSLTGLGIFGLETFTRSRKKTRRKLRIIIGGAMIQLELWHYNLQTGVLVMTRRLSRRLSRVKNDFNRISDVESSSE